MKKQIISSHVVFIIVVALALIAALGWVLWQNSAKDPVVKETSTGVVDKSEDQSTSPTEVLSITPMLAGTSLKLGVPSSWSVGSNSTDTLSRTIDGEEFRIQFILATDSHVDDRSYVYSHFVTDYAAGDNVNLKTVLTSSGKSLYLVKSASQRDVVLRTCAEQTDTECYLTHEGLPLIVRLFTNIPHSQGYAGLKDFDSAATATAISDFSEIATSLDY